MTPLHRFLKLAATGVDLWEALEKASQGPPQPSNLPIEPGKFQPTAVERHQALQAGVNTTDPNAMYEWYRSNRLGQSTRKAMKKAPVLEDPDTAWGSVGIGTTPYYGPGMISRIAGGQEAAVRGSNLATLGQASKEDADREAKRQFTQANIVRQQAEAEMTKGRATRERAEKALDDPWGFVSEKLFGKGGFNMGDFWGKNKSWLLPVLVGAGGLLGGGLLGRMTAPRPQYAAPPWGYQPPYPPQPQMWR